MQKNVSPLVAILVIAVVIILIVVVFYAYTGESGHDRAMRLLNEPPPRQMQQPTETNDAPAGNNGSSETAPARE